MSNLESSRVSIFPWVSVPSYTSLVEDSKAYPMSWTDILITIVVWPCIIAVPLILTYDNLYKDLFSSDWYDVTPRDFWTSGSGWPSPVGLSLGIFAVVVGQICVLIYFISRKLGYLGSLQPIQKVGSPKYDVIDGLLTHLAQPEGFVMLGAYLI